MILSFKHKGLELFFTTGSIAGIQAKHATKLRLQLDALNRATCPQDMNAPSWRLHPLKVISKSIGRLPYMETGELPLNLKMDMLKSLIIKITTRSYYENVQSTAPRFSVKRIY